MRVTQARKRGWLRIVGLASLCVFLGCATTGSERGASQPSIPTEALLRVGVTPTSPPLVFRQAGHLVGLEVELASALAKTAGKSVRFIEVPWADLIPALLEDRIDIIMSGMSVTRLREVRIAFTSPYLRTGQIALVRREDFNEFPSASSIKNTGRRVGFVKGTTGSFLVEQEFPLAAKKSPFASPDQGAQALIEGRIDLLIHDAPIIVWTASEREADSVVPIPSLLTEERFAWGVRKDDTEVLKAANTFLETWKRSGKLDRAIKHWMPFAPELR